MKVSREQFERMLRAKFGSDLTKLTPQQRIAVEKLRAHFDQGTAQLEAPAQKYSGALALPQGRARAGRCPSCGGKAYAPRPVMALPELVASDTAAALVERMCFHPFHAPKAQEQTDAREDRQG